MFPLPSHRCITVSSLQLPVTRGGHPARSIVRFGWTGAQCSQELGTEPDEVAYGATGTLVVEGDYQKIGIPLEAGDIATAERIPGKGGDTFVFYVGSPACPSRAVAMYRLPEVPARMYPAICLRNASANVSVHERAPAAVPRIWRPDRCQLFPKSSRDLAILLLLLAGRGTALSIPGDVLWVILGYASRELRFSVVPTATPGWLWRRHIIDPRDPATVSGMEYSSGLAELVTDLDHPVCAFHPSYSLWVDPSEPCAGHVGRVRVAVGLLFRYSAEEGSGLLWDNMEANPFEKFTYGPDSFDFFLLKGSQREACDTFPGQVVVSVDFACGQVSVTWAGVRHRITVQPLQPPVYPYVCLDPGIAVRTGAVGWAAGPIPRWWDCWAEGVWHTGNNMVFDEGGEDWGPGWGVDEAWAWDSGWDDAEDVEEEEEEEGGGEEEEEEEDCNGDGVAV